MYNKTSKYLTSLQHLSKLVFLFNYFLQSEFWQTGVMWFLIQIKIHSIQVVVGDILLWITILYILVQHTKFVYTVFVWRLCLAYVFTQTDTTRAGRSPFPLTLQFSLQFSLSTCVANYTRLCIVQFIRVTFLLLWYPLAQNSRRCRDFIHRNCQLSFTRWYQPKWFNHFSFSFLFYLYYRHSNSVIVINATAHSRSSVSGGFRQFSFWQFFERWSCCLIYFLQFFESLPVARVHRRVSSFNSLSYLHRNQLTTQ